MKKMIQEINKQAGDKRDKREKPDYSKEDIIVDKVFATPELR